jgi:cell division protein FtsI/penicillin-binding protein 2
MKFIYLGIFLNRKGFGYACIETPEKLLEYGIVSVRPWDAYRIYKRVSKYLAMFQPTALVLRDVNAIESKRIQKLTHDLVELAVEQNVSVHQYSREEVQKVFEIVGATSKMERAKAIVENGYEELKDRLPKRSWPYEDYNMGIFDALALIRTHQCNMP